jgi:hypothetical protein
MRKVALACVLALGLGACATGAGDTSDARVYYNTVTTYNSVMDSLVTARRADKISDERYTQIENARVCVNDALDAMKPKATDDVEGNLPEAALRSSQECLDRLIVQLSKTQEQ